VTQRDIAVVNADSMQVYDTLRVLTARPSEEEMQGVPHHLYGHVPAGAAYSTGAWLRDVSAGLAVRAISPMYATRPARPGLMLGFGGFLPE
ncbi:hypothetical protein ACCT04_35040, partial [Rhizobium ruizarguesonis]